MNQKARKFLRKAASKLLEVSEQLYLRAYGWQRNPEYDDAWSSPPGYPKKHNTISRGHAINSMKKYTNCAIPWEPGQNPDYLEDPLHH